MSASQQDAALCISSYSSCKSLLSKSPMGKSILIKSLRSKSLVCKSLFSKIILSKSPLCKSLLSNSLLGKRATLLTKLTYEGYLTYEYLSENNFCALALVWGLEGVEAESQNTHFNVQLVTYQ